MRCICLIGDRAMARVLADATRLCSAVDGGGLDFGN